MNVSNLNDTIAALSTPPGKGAISVIRVSGKEAFATVEPHFRKWVAASKRTGSRGLTCFKRKKELLEAVFFKKEKRRGRFFGVIVDGDEIIDEVILSVYHTPNSYTGEDMVEISCHGNTFIVQKIMRLLLKKTRLANPGEFTQRAFFNNKIDLTQAEAVGDLLNATTEVVHRTAMMQLKGCLKDKISSLLDELTEYRIQIETEIDFTEQDLPELDLEELKKNLVEFQEKLRKLIKTGKEGRIFREGLTVCLAGYPNVGKSSIFNRLLGTNRAIVTTRPGTTRDYLEESLSINGFLVRLIDTAGLCQAQDEVEAIGIKLSRDIIESADKVLLIEDGYLRWESRYRSLLTEIEEKPIPIIRKTDPRKCLDEEIEHATSEKKIIHILNKADILDKETISDYESHGYLPVSAKTGEGIEELKELIVAELHLSKEDLNEGVLTNVRQVKAVEDSLKSIENIIKAIEEGVGIEFIAFDLKVASESLEEIIGKVTDDDLLDKIFADFCIGK